VLLLLIGIKKARLFSYGFATLPPTRPPVGRVSFGKDSRSQSLSITTTIKDVNPVDCQIFSIQGWQGFGSGFQSDPDSIGSVDPDPDSESGSGMNK
jgi:hypothetical protein